MHRRPNVLIITLDSCRWDSFEQGAAALRPWGTFRRAYAQGTYTLPSHVSIYNGILPNTIERIPYFNRFEKNLFRISGRPGTHIPSLITFAPGSKDIFDGFQRFGYDVLGIGAVDWFLSEILTGPFPDFHFTGTDLATQIEIVEERLAGAGVPLAALLNIGETHDPYACGGRIEPSLASRARMREGRATGYLAAEHRKQIDACAWVAGRLDRLFDRLRKLPRDTLVVLCSDHGECFGEDGAHGHGFYHPLIMEVPLGIFCLREPLDQLADLA